MLNRFTPALFLSTTLWVAPASVADVFPVDAPITAVKIHRDYGAIVTRSLTLDLPAGDHQIKISDITNALDEDYALKAGVVSGNVLVTQVRLDEVFLPNTGREAQQTLLAKLKSLETEQATDRTSVEAINMQLAFIQNMAGEAAKSGEFASPSELMEALQESFDFVKSNTGTLLKERQNLNAKMIDRAAEIEATRAEIRQLGGTRISAVEGTLDVSTDVPGPVELTVSYLVEDADWSVDAEANLDSMDGQTQLKMFARISQETNEDWRNVSVALSTTQPSYDIGYDEPYPVYFNLQDPVSMEQMISKVRSGRAANSLDIQEVVVTGSRFSNYTSNQFDAEFSLPSRVSLQADGSEQRFLLQDHEAASATIIRTAPNSATTAFVYGDTRFSSLPHISEPRVTLTRDGTYIGTGTWPDLRADEPLKLPFGPDAQIDVQVIRIPSEDGDTGIFNRRQVTENKQQFQVTNHHAQPVVVEVFDARPNSMNEDLEIEALRGSTRPTATDVDGQPGVIMWRKEVAPGETWEINHWYRMSYPTDKRLSR